MDKQEISLLKINKDLGELNKKVNFLQELILNMKNEFELINRGNLKEKFFAQLTTKADERMDLFMTERSSQCDIERSSQCTFMVEKKIFYILRTYIEKGVNDALKLARGSVIYTTNMAEKVDCPDKNCFNNIINSFKTLEELLSISQNISLNNTKKLYSLSINSNLEDGTEEELSNLLAPLSNAIRLKILKIISNGGKFYTQLERLSGIKGGHMQYHLKTLMDAGYVEKSNGKYVITMNGLIIIRFLNELRSKIYLKNVKKTPLPY